MIYFCTITKPICKGAMLHTLCVTKGLLTKLKLHAQVYGGAKDDDLDGIYDNNQTYRRAM